MLQKLSNHINTNLPFLQGKKILIAISGGIDSVVLTHLLSKLYFNISLAHCNFNLRDKESDLDEAFVRELGKNLNTTVYTTSFNTLEYSKINKQSTQIAARNLRYTWFNKLVKENNFDYILTAHHADDNLETFLINLTRGSGLKGLTGIPVVNGNIVRPLLTFSREEITHFAKENNITWREDISNASTKYIRNKIRHKVTPILKEINPNLLDSFTKTSEHLQEAAHIVNDRITEISKKVVSKISNTPNINLFKIDIKELQKLSNTKAYLYQLLKDYNFTEWNDVYNLLHAQSGKQVFSKTHKLLKDRHFLFLSTKENTQNTIEEIEILEEIHTITTPITLYFKEVTNEGIKNKNTIYVNKQLISYPLKLRKWQNGDAFFPKGMRGKKKLSKYFKDEKLSLIEKQNTWLLCNADNEIIWIISHRQDNRFLIDKNTKSVLQITFK